ncbi:MAG TPA: hypothetical protein VNW49_04425 [Puia sp.]|jgi:hypothetical protein|nr:hypothetical protein [Puia sp.]
MKQRLAIYFIAGFSTGFLGFGILFSEGWAIRCGLFLSLATTALFGSSKERSLLPTLPL